MSNESNNQKQAPKPKRVKIARLWFFLAWLAVTVAVIVVSFLDYSGVLNNLAPSAVVVAAIVNLALIRGRETSIAPRFRWRFWYLTIISLPLASSAITLSGTSLARSPSQAMLGFFFLYLLVAMPVFISGSIQRGSPASQV